MSNRLVKKMRSKAKLNFSKHVLLVSRSNKNILAQIIEPTGKKTIFTATSAKMDKGSKTEKAKQVGKQIADFVKSKKIDALSFDRNGYVYHGRVQAMVESVRSAEINI